MLNKKLEQCDADMENANKGTILNFKSKANLITIFA